MVHENGYPFTGLGKQPASLDLLRTPGAPAVRAAARRCSHTRQR